MKTITNHLISRVAHSPLIQEVIKYKEKQQLNKLSNSHCYINNLRYISRPELDKIFVDLKNEMEWTKVAGLIGDLDLPEMMGGVNRGDQRALFYLINSLKPANVLEIGTHIGCSTIHIALALRGNAIAHLTTVDLIDVNDPVSKHWQHFNSKHSPSKLMEMVGVRSRVTFIKADSIHFLENCREKFDFVFLDGSHKAKMVFQEVPLALRLLNKNGVVLLHDYFPDNKPLWKNIPTIPGPYLALSKIMNEENNISVLPLGALPWETKARSNYTSLALLTRR